MAIKSYSELVLLQTFEERLKYLQTYSKIGIETFGHLRYINQVLYGSYEWKRFRIEIILRDCGRDMALPGYEILSDDKMSKKDIAMQNAAIVIHHINPLTIDDVVNRSRKIFDSENVVCVSENTHKLIHYCKDPILIHERHPGDTKLW